MQNYKSCGHQFRDSLLTFVFQLKIPCPIQSPGAGWTYTPLAIGFNVIQRQEMGYCGRDGVGFDVTECCFLCCEKCIASYTKRGKKGGKRKYGYWCVLICTILETHKT